MNTDAKKLEFGELSPIVTAAFAASGVVCIRGLVNLAGVEELREWIEIALDNPDPRYSGNPKSTYKVDSHLWTRLDGFRAFAFNSDIGRAAAVVMGSREARMYN